MSDLSLDLTSDALGTLAYRDLVISGGDLVLTQDASASAAATDPTLQLVCQRLLWFLGEYFLDTSDGTPWLQSVLVKGASQQTIDALIQDRILGTPGVAILTAYKSTAFRAQRLYKIEFSIITTSGAALGYTLPVNVGTGG
ncbi:MAG: hypothetical protein EOO38_00105 [Cytophagaceae bacterium]|nr:MAG: hypothetical protein EOO38_00105 [Cytophagaceae bacterium]